MNKIFYAIKYTDESCNDEYLNINHHGIIQFEKIFNKDSIDFFNDYYVDSKSELFLIIKSDLQFVNLKNRSEILTKLLKSKIISVLINVKNLDQESVLFNLDLLK